MQFTTKMHLYLGCIALLAIAMPVISWAQDLKVSVEAVDIDLSDQGANYADLQLIYAKPEEKQENRQSQIPFQLYLIGTDSRDQRARALALYEFDKTGWQKKLATPMDSEVNLSQLIDADPAPRLVTHAEGTLEVLDVQAQSFKPLIKLPSILIISASIAIKFRKVVYPEPKSSIAKSHPISLISLANALAFSGSSRATVSVNSIVTRSAAGPKLFNAVI